ncbi:SBP-like protein [Artemisia annua]|uniref:SBP-like protein n=1 Tax=Artemisia annua TaxID=35608 RepID=A0A2U1MVB1_ARTAN|nr:SBP-like protein [Artemisia annua]
MYVCCYGANQAQLFFYKKLVGGSTRTGYDYDSVKRWTAQKKLGYGLDECDKDKKFQYLDLLGGTDKKVLRALVCQSILDEFSDGPWQLSFAFNNGPVVQTKPAVSSMWENTCNSKHSVATVKAEKYGGHDVLTHSQGVQFPNLVSMPPTLSFKRNISSKLILNGIYYNVGTNVGRDNKKIARGQHTNEITIRKNSCNNENWRRILVNKLERENGNKE